MEPNDSPILSLPLEFSGDGVEKLIEFLHRRIGVLERYYGGLLINRFHELEPAYRRSR